MYDIITSVKGNYSLRLHRNTETIKNILDDFIPLINISLY